MLDCHPDLVNDSFLVSSTFPHPAVIMEFPDLGRFGLLSLGVYWDTFDFAFHEGDMRRAIRVTMPKPGGLVPPDDDPEYQIPLKKAADVLTRHIDHLPPQAVKIEVDQGGNLVSVSTNPSEDAMRGTDHFLLKDYQLPPSATAKTVLRSELTEIGRLLGHVDLVSYPDHLRSTLGKEENQPYVFKYSTGAAFMVWKEVQMLASPRTRTWLS
jgi:hypothetical protein